jgi:plasmid stabilization system protein ParE
MESGSAWPRKPANEYAGRTLEELVRTFSELAETPGIGHRRPDLTRLPLHFHFAAPYMVI